MLSIYIAGLKKQTGKTLLAAGLAGTMQSLSYATSYYKPVQTGSDIIYNDCEFVNKIDKHIKTSTTYKLQSSSHPLIGVYKERLNNIDITKIMHDYKQNIMTSEFHIVEGNNGISSPLDQSKTEIDIIQHLGLPVILVINPNITKIDEVICGINYIFSKKVNLMGVVINDHNNASTDIEIKYFPELITEYTAAKILGIMPHYENFEALTPQTLIFDILNRLNIEDIFNLKIAELR